MRKEIKNYEGLYEVDTEGNIFNKRTGRKLKQSNSGGYKLVHLSCYGMCKCHWVHRIVLETFKGYPGADYEVDHINEDKTDNRLENLRWLTHAENVRRSVKGRPRYDLKKAVLDIRDPENIIEYDDAKACSKATGYSVSSIRKHCHGEYQKINFMFKGDVE